MIIPLIPLFLAASIGLIENEIAMKDSWRHGPEAIYEAFARVSHFNNTPNNFTSFLMPAKIACRPKNSDSLMCRFHDGSYRRLTKKEQNPEKFQHLESNGDEELFELIFRRDGLKKIVVSPFMDYKILDVLKTWVGQFNVGADVYDLGRSQFETTENSTTGVCQTAYVLSSRNASLDDETDKPWDMLMLRVKIPVKNRVMEMRRTRNLAECHYQTYYYSGLEINQENGLRVFDSKIKSSNSEMLIGRKTFSSTTENTIVVTDKFDSRANVVTEKISLTLIDIVPAIDPLPTFNGPTIETSIFPGDYFNSNQVTTLESSSEEEISASDERNDLS